MSGSAVELDFFPIQKRSSPTQKLLHRRQSFRDIQRVISKMNPELLKTVIASGSSNGGKSPENGTPSNNSFSVPSTPNKDQLAFPALPVYTPTFSRSASFDQSNAGTATLTIFYNGSVVVFDVSPHQAAKILKFAQGGGFKAVESTDSKPGVSPNDEKHLLYTLGGDLPIARKKSLQRFLEKRKERMTLVSPYGCPTDNANSLA